MKTTLTALMALATACVMPPTHCFAEATRQDAVSLPVRVARYEGWEVTVGSSVHVLLNRFPAPNSKLTEHIWLYEQHSSMDQRAQDLGCHTLLVTVGDGHVIEMRLVNPRAREVIANHVLRTKRGTYASVN